MEEKARIHHFGDVPKFSKIFVVTYNNQFGTNCSERVEADTKTDVEKFMISQYFVKKIMSVREL